MSKNAPITILESDPAIRQILVDYLDIEKLSDDVILADPEGFKLEKGAAISLQENEDNPLKLHENDVFLKPVRLGKLLARIRYHRARLKEQSFPENLKIGPYKLDWRNNTMSKRGESFRLTEKETGLLKLLYQAEGKIVSREELLDSVWGYVDGVETHTLETHIYRLRQKIEQDAANPKILLTAENGYQLAD